MGFSALEREGCRKILDQMATSDILSLYETVIKAKTEVRVRAELIEKIIEESKSAEELLKRRKVCRDLILQYLNKERIFMYVKSTKQEAIQRSLKYWQEPLRDTAPDTDPTQLSNQIAGLSINSNKEVGSQVDKGELLAKSRTQTSTPGARAKSKPAPNTSPSSTISVTVSFTSGSNQLTGQFTRSMLQKGPRQQKNK